MKDRALILAVGGGKGGVGKSMVSANLAVQYARSGLQVIVIDLDFGAANLHTLYGIRKAEKGLGQYLTTARSQLTDFVTQTSIPNLELIAGTGFVPEMANLKYAQKVKLIRQIKMLDADVILLDLGAGSSNNVVDFFSMTDAGIVVTTPEPTAIVNSYEFLKNVVYRLLQRMMKNTPEALKLIKASTVPGNSLGIDRIPKLIEAIKDVHPWAADTSREVLSELNFGLVFNQARHASQAELGQKLRGICHKYLGVDLNFAGMIYHDPEVSHAVFKMRPISLLDPDCIVSRALKRVAAELLNQLTTRIKGGSQEDFSEQFQRVKNQAKRDFTESVLAGGRRTRALKEFSVDELKIL